MVNLSHDEAREIARATVEELFRKLDIDVNDPDAMIELRENIKFAGRQRRGSEEVSTWVKRTAVGASVMGLLWVIVEGVRKAFGS